MNRRGFLSSCLALGAAPMIGKAELLMPARKIIAPSEELEIVSQPLVINRIGRASVRAEAREVLIAWLAMRTDEMMFRQLVGDVAYARDRPY